MARVQRTPQAEADLAAILDDLDDRSPAAAERYAREINARVDQLGRFPESGRSREELVAGLRSVVVKPYLVFYRRRGDDVVIVRILDGRRDLPGLFGEIE